jgi:GDP-4-dehydro-6-deoxy-D-mannose reductase
LSKRAIKNRVLITGAAGFLGRHLYTAACKNGFMVKMTDRIEPGGKSGSRFFFLADLGNPQDCLAMVKWANSQVIYHLGGLTGNRSPQELLDAHAGNTMNLINALAANAWKGTFVLASSTAVYGVAGQKKIREDDPMEPITSYGASKAAQEMTAMSGWTSPEVKLIRARLSNLIGPGQPATLFASSVARQIASAESGAPAVIRVGNLASRRDFVDVRDAATALVSLVEKKATAGAYNICTGRSLAVREILDLLLGLSSVRIKVQKDLERLRAGDIPDQRCDPHKIRAATGWRPRIRIRQSLLDLVQGWRAEIRR